MTSLGVLDNIFVNSCFYWVICLCYFSLSEIYVEYFCFLIQCMERLCVGSWCSCAALECASLKLTVVLWVSTTSVDGRQVVWISIKNVASFSIFYKSFTFYCTAKMPTIDGRLYLNSPLLFYYYFPLRFALIIVWFPFCLFFWFRITHFQLFGSKKKCHLFFGTDLLCDISLLSECLLIIFLLI